MRIDQFISGEAVDRLIAILLLVGPDGSILDANAAAMACYGYSHAEILALNIRDIRAPQDQVAIEGQMQQAVEHGVLFEAMHRRSDGTLFPVEVRSAPVTAEDESALLSVVSDITERKRAQDALREGEEELRQPEEKFSAAFDAPPDLVSITRISDGMLLEVNKGYERLLGYARGESVGKTTSELAIWADPADRATFIATLEESGEVTDFETTLRRKDGTLVPVLDSARTFDLQGEACVLSVVRDITERKLAEEERLARLRFVEALDRVNRAIQGAGDLERMMGDVLDEVLSIFDCDRTFLMHPCDPEAASWRTPMERNRPEYPGILDLELEMPMDAEVAETLRVLLDADDPVEFGPGTEHPLPADVSQRFGFQSFMSMALYPKIGKPWQFGIHECSYPRVWTTEEKRLLREIGRRLTDALTSLLSQRDLQKSEAKYRRIVDTATEGIWVLGPDAMTTFVNTRMAQMLGYDGEEIIGRPLVDFMLEEDVPDHLSKMDNRRQGLSENYERRFRHKDGQAVWTHASATPIFDDEQHFGGSMAMFTDITEHKQAEEELRESEEKYRRLLQKIKAAVIVHGADTQIQTSNPMAQELLGLTEDQMLGKTAIDPAWHFLRDDGAVMPHEEYPVAKVVATRGALRDYVVGVHSPGREAESDVWVLVNADPVLDREGGLAQVIVTFVDITDRKKAEEALRDSERKLSIMFDSIPDGIVIAEVASGQIVGANEGFFEMAGLTREQALGKTTTELSLWADAEDRRRFREQVVLHGAVHDFESTFRGASGDMFPGVISSTLVDIGGEPCSLVLVRDVTERKRAEEALRETEERFETVFRASPVSISLSRLSDGVLLDVNDAYLELFGLGRGDVVGRPVDEIAVGADPEDRKRVLTELVECGRVSSSEVEFLAHGGERKQLLEVAELVEIAGEPCVLGFAQDISELVRARDSLRESEAQYRAVVETSLDGFWVADSEGRILEVNDAYARRSGYSRDELLRMRIVDLDAKLSPDEIAGLIATTIERGGQIFETAHRTKAGDVWPIEVAASYWPTLGGRHFMFVRDIEKRKHAELLAEARADLAEIEKSADVDALLRAALDKAELMTGSSVSFFHFVSDDQDHLSTQMLSTNTLAVIHVAEAAGRHLPLSEAGVWAECVRTHGPVIHNSYDSLPGRNGLPPDHAPIVRELVLPILRAGKVVAIIGVGNKTSDYTQDDVNDVDAIASMVADLALRRKTQDEFEHFFEFVPEMVCIISSNGCFHRLNSAWERVLGYAQAELLGRPLLELVHPEDREEAATHFDTQLREPVAVVGYANRYRAKDGTYCWLEWNVAPMAGEFRFAAARDITRRKVDEERLLRYQTRLRALAAELVISAERERGRLGVELHDGLGQMLTAAKLSAQIVAAEQTESPGMEQAQKLVELLGESIGEVRLLTSELAPTVLFELGLGAALLWLRDRYSQLYGLKCTIRVDVRAEHLRGETAMFMFRFVREALNNVVRHSQVMRATVSVGRARECNSASVSDRGIGFDPVLIDDPGDVGGFGLFSIREECLSMGGTMEVSSEPGHGTRIRVRIPDSANRATDSEMTPTRRQIP